MSDNLPAVIPAPVGWQPIDQGPHDRPVILFCPYTDSPDGTGAHPDAKIKNGRVVGWWSESQMHWVAALPGGAETNVYPSRFAELLGEPQ